MEFRGDLGMEWGEGMERARDGNGIKGGKGKETGGRKDGSLGRGNGIWGVQFASVTLGGI